MPLPRASAEHYRQQQALTALTVAAARRSWAEMGEDFDRTWPAVLRRLLLLLAAAQIGSARQGAEYVAAVLAEQEVDVAPDGEVVPERLAGVASDGRPLPSLLTGALVTAKRAMAVRADATAALAVGARWLDMAAQTQVADASRAAVSVGIAARPGVGWTRMVNPPCCARCAVLAGRFYRWSSGFDRHLRCDCRHIPSTEDVAGDLTTDPDALLRRGQIRGLTRAEQAALDEGGDLARVVNARRGRQGLATLELAKRGQVRPTPEGIHRRARTREEAVELLGRHGYLR